MKTTLSNIIFKKTIWIIFFLIFSIVGFVYIYTVSLIKKEFLTYVENYQKLKSEKENFLFKNATKDVSFLANHFKQELKHKKSKHFDFDSFDKYFEIKEDGSLRSKKNRELVKPVLFLNKDVKLTDDLKNKLIIINHVLDNVSFGVSDFYYNTWVVFPENGNFCISKQKPFTNFEIPADFTDLTEQYWKISTQKENLKREPKWTDLYYDPSFKSWMISYLIPVDVNGVHELTVGVDISLNYMFDEIVSGYSFSKNFILSKDGKIIMHPDYLDKVKLNQAKVSDYLNDVSLSKSFELISNNQMGIVKFNKGILSLSQIKDDWILVSYYSNDLIYTNFWKTFPMLLMVSFFVIFVFYWVLFKIFKQEVINPLRVYSKYFDKIKRGNYSFKISTDRKDEFGDLSLAFKAMVEKIQETNSKLNSKNEQLEKDLKDSISKTVASSKLVTLGEMSAGVAHEINNPLTGILGNLEFLKRDLSKTPIDLEKANSRIDKSLKLVERISKIVVGLKMFSRNSENDQMEPTEIDKIFDEVSDLTKVKMANKNVQLLIEPSSGLKVKCKEPQILQVLVNLVNNSFDAILENEKLTEKWVKLSTQVDGDIVKVKVTDSGSGIPEEVIDKMFNPFYTTKPIGKGTGLGLSISKGIIDQHLGKFYYNKESKNTEFILELPVERT